MLKSKKLLLFLSVSCLLEADNASSLLFNGNCLTCHHETKTVSAPSMVELRSRYLSVFSKKEDFVNYMSAWVEHPNAKTSIMQDAIKKHALMPDLGFDKEVLRDISTYIYETDFKKRGGLY
ncbi:cytochrome C [Sulfurimonas sp.]|uniref:cytochrome C n=1 Tax=Sulfurimonas sp. TaxID=2022749 RepID=UPI0025EC619C|nr:cytochrome C [Sulfurimonas sp.]MDD5158054.1 cytochrome C [Sulfurimonas sp.]